MGENREPRTAISAAQGPAQSTPSRGFDRYGNPVTAQLRIVGQRRREAEEKLDRHLQDARTKPEKNRTAESSGPTATY